MRYPGSKRRLVKYILPIILENRKENQLYVEPFVGGCNSIQHVTGRRWGNDSHKELIAMWKAVQSGWIPPTYISESDYLYMKNNQNLFDPHLVGFIGFNSSFGSKWWGGYARDSKGVRNFTDEGSRGLVKQSGLISNVKFTCMNYADMIFEEECVIYCDPPYANTTKYKDSFDSEKFYEWCRQRSLEGHAVFVSEYSAPKDFELVFEKEQSSALPSNTSSLIRTERLFKI